LQSELPVATGEANKHCCREQVLRREKAMQVASSACFLDHTWNTIKMSGWLPKLWRLRLLQLFTTKLKQFRREFESTWCDLMDHDPLRGRRHLMPFG